MSKIKNATLGVLTGLIIGYASAKINKPEYTLKQENKQTYIYSKNQRNKQRIYEINKDIYVGNSDYNLERAIDLAYNMGFRENKKELQEKTKQYQELEQKLKESETKIRRRRFFDRIEKTRDKISFWYQDLKRRQLE